MAGSMLTLTCTVTVADWAEPSVGTVTLEWTGSIENTDTDINVGDQMGSSPTFTRTLNFNPLRTSHGRPYTYVAMSDAGGITPTTANVNVIVQSELAKHVREGNGTTCINTVLS